MFEFGLRHPWIVRQNKMNSPAVDSVGTGNLTGTSRRTSGKADLGAFKFCPSLCGLGTVAAHAKPFFTDGHAIFSDGEVVFVYQRSTALSVQIYERLDTVLTAVFIVRHSIRGRIQQDSETEKPEDRFPNLRR